jgi:hypothetical protein
MEFSGGTLSGRYIPNVNGNREKAARGEPHMWLDLTCMSAGEYREKSSAALAAAISGLDEKKAERDAERVCMLACVNAVGGCSYRNRSTMTQTLGPFILAPGDLIEVTSAAMLVDMLDLSTEVVTALRLRRDIVQAIESRSHLEAGLSPT